VIVRLIIKWILMAVVIGIVAAITPGITVHGGFLTLLWIALIFGLVDAIVGPILRLLSLPLIVLTLGLFLLVINAALLGLTAWLTSKLDIDGFWPAVLGGLLISIFSWAIDQLLLTPEQRRRTLSVRASRNTNSNEWQI
jgi:putative membrane protein